MKTHTLIEYVMNSQKSKARKEATQFKKQGKNLNEHFTKAGSHKANKCMERCLISVAMWQTQMKTEMGISLKHLEFIRVKILTESIAGEDSERNGFLVYHL